MREPQPRTLRPPRAGDEAAPVVTDRGTWGTPPPPFRLPTRERGGEARTWLMLLLALAVALFLGAFSVAQATSERVGRAIAARTLASVGEVDAYLLLHEGALCAQAGDEGAANLDGFAVPDVMLAASEVRCVDGALDRAALRALLLDRGGELLYLRGAEALTAPGQTADPLPLASTEGLVRLTLDLVTAQTHELASPAAWGLGGLAVLLTLVMLLAGGRRARLSRLGTSLILGAVPVVLGAGLLWVLLGVLGSGGPLLQDVRGIVRSLLALVVRNGLVLCVGGVVLLVPGWVWRGSRE